MKLGTFSAFFAGAALLLSAQAQAQQVYWGAGSGVPAQETEAQFDGGLNSWTTNSLYDQNNTTGGNALWTAGTISQGAFSAGSTDIASPSTANGAAIFDSDFLDNAGGSQASGTAPSPHSGALVSPTIDLTAAAGKKVLLSFYSAYRPFSNTTAKVEISYDGGATWPDSFIAAESDVNESKEERRVIEITSSIATAPALNNVKLRFIFDGNYYYWTIDDISILERPDYNLSMDIDDEGETYIYPSGNYLTPVDQVNPAMMSLGASVKNNGQQDETGAKLMMTVDFRDEAGNTTPDFYKDSITFDIESDSTKFLRKLGANTFLPTQEGLYQVTYSVVSAGGNMETITEDNEFTRSFRITPPSTAPLGQSRFSRVPESTAGGPFMRGSGPLITSGENTGDPFETGSTFYITNSTSGNDSIVLDKVVFRAGKVAAAANYDGSQELIARVYEWTDLDGNGSLSSSYDDATAPGTGELQLVAGGVVKPVSATVPVLVEAELIDFVTFKRGYDVKPNTVYFVNVFTANADYGVGSVSTTYGFGGNVDAELDGGLVVPGIPTLLVNGGTSGSNGGTIGRFVPNIQPSLQLTLTLADSLLVNSTENVTKAELEGVKLFPNPTQGEVSVTFEGDAKEISYRVMDFTGRVIAEEIRQNVFNDTFTYDASALPAGMYLININTESGYKTMEFRVTK